MKFIIVISFIILSTFSIADELTNSLANTYESGSIPNFLPQVGKALAGRCYLTTGSNKKIASVLMVSFEEDGYDIAPFDLDKTREDFFDQLNYEEVLNKFPIIKKMYLEVIETADGAIVENDDGEEAFKGEIRETEKYFVMRVFKNEKIIKYCNYKK